MAKIIGNTTATPNPRPDWLQDDAAKADYIKNKPELGTIAAKNEIAKSDLASDVQSSLDKADSAIQEHQSLAGLATEKYVDNKIAAIPTPDVSGQINEHNTSNDAHADIRQQIENLGDMASKDKVSKTDLTDDVQASLNKASALQSETDPTVPAWAKASTKPTYTANEVGAVSYTAQTLTEEQKAQARSNIGAGASSFSGSYNDLTDKPTIPSTDGLATETYVDNKVASMVDSAPETLNTLNELAAALGDDPNFATTIATQIGNKADAEHDHGDTYAYKNEATTTVTDDGEGNVVLTNVAVDEDSLTETDPTVPDWAKQPNKPVYTWDDINDKPFTDGKLNPDCLPDDIGGGSETAVEYTEQTLTEEQKAQARTNIGVAPAYTYGTTDLTAGTSALETGKLYFVYE